MAVMTDIIGEVNLRHLAKVFYKGDGSRLDFMIEAFLGYWLSWYLLPNRQKAGWISMSSHRRSDRRRVWGSPWPLSLYALLDMTL